MYLMKALEDNTISTKQAKNKFIKTPISSYLLSSEEEENVSFVRLTHVDLDHGPDGRLQVVPLRLRCVENLYGVRAPGDGQQWAAVKVHLELPSVERGAHDDDLSEEDTDIEGVCAGS